MLTATPTPSTISHTRVRLDLPGSGGRARVGMATAGPDDRPVIRPVLMASYAEGAKVSLMPEGALLLAGDAIAIEICVGPGARLELVEPAGTVAYAMAGGRASWDVSIDLAPGACLIWAGEPFVVAAGAQVTRNTRIRIGPGATLACRETLVLGRHGEAPGTLSQTLSVSSPRTGPLLKEDLHLQGPANRLLLGGARAMGTVLVVGRRLPEGYRGPNGTRLELESPGTMVRHLAAEAHLATSSADWAAARDAVD